MKLTYSMGVIDTDLIIQAMRENGVIKLEVSKSYDKEAFDVDVSYQTPILTHPSTATNEHI